MRSATAQGRVRDRGHSLVGRADAPRPVWHKDLFTERGVVRPAGPQVSRSFLLVAARGWAAAHGYLHPGLGWEQGHIVCVVGLVRPACRARRAVPGRAGARLPVQAARLGPAARGPAPPRPRRDQTGGHDSLIFTRRVSVCAGDHDRRAEDPGRLARARKTLEVTVEPGTYQITVGPGTAINAPGITSRDIRRHKASNYSHEWQPSVSSHLPRRHGRPCAQPWPIADLRCEADRLVHIGAGARQKMVTVGGGPAARRASRRTCWARSARLCGRRPT
jgi:hypothetical protein